MRFNPRANIGGGRTRDVGGSRGGGGMGNLPIGGITGGGIGTVVVVIIIFVLSQFLGGGGGGGGAGAGPQGGTDRYANCRTGADANQSADCARQAVELSLRSYWTTTLPRQANTRFETTEVVTFTGGTTTGCGQADSSVGPFYCPTDQTIYLDTTFFADVLEGQLGGQGGDFVEPYVLAHEYGHHIQNLLGTMGRVKTQEGPTSDAVRLELQADCYSGMWTQGALSTTDTEGVRIFESIDDSDIEEALDAAKTVGDDRIQQQSGGGVDKERWTHGSSAQRMRWFRIGYDDGTMEDCDTFSASKL